MMHAARIERSERLQRVHGLLSDGEWHSTRDIMREADVCAVNSVAAELRENGFYIEGKWSKDPITGRRIFLYRMPFAGLSAA